MIHSQSKRISNHSKNSVSPHYSKQTTFKSMNTSRKQQLSRVMKAVSQIADITNDNHKQIKLIKANIINKLKNRIINKSRSVSTYYLLTNQNKNFLMDNYLSDLMMMNTTSEKLQKQIEKQKMNEFKEWIKNPQLFESCFNIKLTKQSLKQILTPKYDLLRMMYFLQSFIEQNGLKYKGSNFKMTLIQSGNLGHFLMKLQEIKCAKKSKIIQQKLWILELLDYNIANETDIKTINEYMSCFVKLYHSMSSSNSYTRFNASRQAMKYFNFLIDQTTVVLRNPQLNYHKSYQPVSYQSEFAFINDGEYVFNNEYRPNFLCVDEIIDAERSVNTMIGSEYMMSENCWESEGKLVEINSFLKSDKKIFLRLRLNSVEFDKITIKILNPTSWQNLITNKKDSQYQFTLQIIPDEGDNKHIYGFTKKEQQQNEQCKNDQSMVQQQQQHQLILQDDVISLYLSQDENFVICWNETRSHLISQISINKPVITLIENLSFEFELSIGIVLYTTASQVEIYNPK